MTCNWCSYAAADGAGAARVGYPPNLRIMRVDCTGRVTPELILRALRGGADGVLVCGCHMGDCHYVDGNVRASARLALLRRTLTDLGIEGERLRLEWVGAAEGERFAAVAREMVVTVRGLGPLTWPDLTDVELEGTVPLHG